MKVAILGEGAWGTALATVCAQTAQQVTMWCHSPERAQEINTAHTNKQYMPGVILAERIVATADSVQAVTAVDVIIIAIPVPYIRQVLLQARAGIQKQLVMITSKGIERSTGKLPMSVCQETLGIDRFAIISGPSFAHELAQQQLTGMTVASVYREDLPLVRSLFRVEFVVLQNSSDLNGLQVCGAFKNIIALAVGLLDGADYGENTKILLIMLLIDELKILLNHYQAESATINTFAGSGDIMLTALGSKGKNRSAGARRAQGESLNKLEQAYGTLPEGFNTLAALQPVFEQTNTLKITKTLYQIIYQDLTIDQLIDCLKEAV